MQDSNKIFEWCALNQIRVLDERLLFLPLLLSWSYRWWVHARQIIKKRGVL